MITEMVVSRDYETDELAGFGCRIRIADVTMQQWIDYWDVWLADFHALPEERKRNPGLVLAAKFSSFVKTGIMDGEWWRVGQEHETIKKFSAETAEMPPMVVTKWASGLADEIITAEHEIVPKNKLSRQPEQG